MEHKAKDKNRDQIIQNMVDGHHKDDDLPPSTHHALIVCIFRNNNLIINILSSL
jgi:hypothetical protein